MNYDKSITTTDAIPNVSPGERSNMNVKKQDKHSGNEAEDFLLKLIIKIVATTAIMALITVATIFYI